MPRRTIVRKKCICIHVSERLVIDIFVSFHLNIHFYEIYCSLFRRLSNCDLCSPSRCEYSVRDGCLSLCGSVMSTVVVLCSILCCDIFSPYLILTKL